MLTIPWFEEDIPAKTELHAYLSTTGELKLTTVTVTAEDRVCCDDSVPRTFEYCCHLFECAGQQHRCRAIIYFLF